MANKNSGEDWGYVVVIVVAIIAFAAVLIVMIMKGAK
jgi:hypothetical protein